jgi:hypothetical protein
MSQSKNINGKEYIEFSPLLFLDGMRKKERVMYVKERRIYSRNGVNELICVTTLTFSKIHCGALLFGQPLTATEDKETNASKQI